MGGIVRMIVRTMERTTWKSEYGVGSSQTWIKSRTCRAIFSHRYSTTPLSVMCTETALVSKRRPKAVCRHGRGTLSQKVTARPVSSDQGRDHGSSSERIDIEGWRKNGDVHLNSSGY